MNLSINLVAADVRRLILFPSKGVRTSLRRLLQFRVSKHKGSHQGILTHVALLLLANAALAVADDWPQAAANAARTAHVGDEPRRPTASRGSSTGVTK